VKHNLKEDDVTISTEKAMTVSDSGGLEAIAAEIRHEVEQAELSWQTAVRHAIRAGELLAEAKASVQHGQWLPWLRANFPGSERTAQNYMRLAANPQRVADLPTVRSAIAAIATPGPAGDEPDEDDGQELQLPETADEVRGFLLAKAFFYRRPEQHPEVLKQADEAAAGLPGLNGAKFLIQAASAWRQEFIDVLMALASDFKATHPALADASAAFAGALMDEEALGPDADDELAAAVLDRLDVARERWQVLFHDYEGDIAVKHNRRRKQ
jgi:hypothetical protein